jgi:hypothetical protein
MLAVDHVIHISVDGLASNWLEPLMQDGDGTVPLPHFQRLAAEGTFTYNARTDFSHTNTLPNHASMLTGRPVLTPPGRPATVPHNWTSNSDPPTGTTLHNNHPHVDYLASAFDVVHDRGGGTGLFASKSKFSLFDVSYNEQHGAVDNDTTGGDNGRDKVDVYFMHTGGQQLVDGFVQELTQRQLTYSLLHFRDPDSAGHAYGWGSDEWNAAVARVDGYLGQVMRAVEADSSLKDSTAIVLTADHGGKGAGHDDPGQLDSFRVPFFIWGPQVPAGQNMYDVFSAVVADPGEERPDYNAVPAPVRNGDSGNVVVALLGHPPIPGSWMVGLHGCIQPSGIGCQGNPVDLTDRDYGDAPLPYPTSKAMSGASHKIEVGFHLGDSVDAESDGQPDLQATGDDFQGDDEDGVVVVSPLQPGAVAWFDISASQRGVLQGWIDWNRDGDWADTGEHVFQDVTLFQGSNHLSLGVPSDISPGTAMARFRFSREIGLTWTGPADAGEVEDHAFRIEESTLTIPLVARDDSYRIPVNTRDMVLHVLANDEGKEPLSLVQVGVPDQGGQVHVGGDKTTLSYSPPDGFTGRESFVYEVQDSLGQRASAEVTVLVEPRVFAEDHVRLRMEAVGPSSESATQLRIGDPFWLEVYVQDVRPSGSGVAAAYVDVTFASQAVAAAGPVEHGTLYSQQTSGDLYPGLVDEAGGQTSSTAIGTDEKLLFRAPLKAQRTGPVVFSIDAADQPGHAIRLLDSSESVPVSRWLVDPLSITIASLTNPLQPLDVDEDGWVAPLDALLVINDLNRSGPRSLSETDDRPEHLIDVNEDGFVSAIDALLVINHLNASSAFAVAANGVGNLLGDQPEERSSKETPAPSLEALRYRLAVAAALDQLDREDTVPALRNNSGQ